MTEPIHDRLFGEEGEGGEGLCWTKEQRMRRPGLPLPGEQAIVCTVLWLAAPAVPSYKDWTHGCLQGGLHAE